VVRLDEETERKKNDLVCIDIDSLLIS
jgi:hypothetical protein